MQIRQAVTRYFIPIRPALLGLYQILVRSGVHRALGHWRQDGPYSHSGSCSTHTEAILQVENIQHRCFLNASRNFPTQIPRGQGEVTMATLFAVAVESYLCMLLGVGQVQSSDSSRCCHRSSDKSRLMEKGFILAYTSRGHSPSWQGKHGGGCLRQLVTSHS